MSRGTRNTGEWSYLGEATVNAADSGDGNRIQLPWGVFAAQVLERPVEDDGGVGDPPPDWQVDGPAGVVDGVAVGTGEPVPSTDPVAAHWSYESLSGTLVLSSGELTDQPRFKWIGDRRVQRADNGYRVVIPKPFFADAASPLERVPEQARVEYGQKRFFLARTAMLEADPASVYVLTRRQLAAMVGGLGDLAAAYERLPSFLT